MALTFDAGANGAGVPAILATLRSSNVPATSRTAGGIVLMHVGSNPDDNSTLDADALPRVIAGLRTAGYSFVTLGALLNP